MRPTKVYLNILLESNCFYCGRFTEPADRSRDHIVPKSLGGCNIKENLVMACKKCNQLKSNKPLQHFLDHNVRKNRREFIVNYIAQIQHLLGQ